MFIQKYLLVVCFLSFAVGNVLRQHKHRHAVCLCCFGKIQQKSRAILICIKVLGFLQYERQSNITS